MNLALHRLATLTIFCLATFVQCAAAAGADEAPQRPRTPQSPAGVGENSPPELPASMRYRSGTGRLKAMTVFKMKGLSEAAVLKGLAWLGKRQNADGSWGETNKPAMTGLALLCFMGHGELPDSKQFGIHVSKAVAWVLDNGTKFAGRLNMEAEMTQAGVYEHGICTFALGEYYTMTRDARVAELYKKAITHIVEGQGPGGGWSYGFDKISDDFCVSGWQIQALRAAELSGLAIPGVDDALRKAVKFVGKIRGPKGGYGYRGPEDRYSLTGAGIAVQLWAGAGRGEVTQGMDWMLAQTEDSLPVKYKSENADLYAWYYHTQAALWYGGGAWQKWNRWFQEEIVSAQNPDGSWPSPGGKMHGPAALDSPTGQTYRTTLCILMLESFYRFVPTTTAGL